tara:strand:+ start:33 stop:929 length:897 start_codon:yes stop_codon:yes gene_type:complete
MKAIKKNMPTVKDEEPFKGLFTQGMVCHETYKDSKNTWLNPDEIEKTKDGSCVKISNGEKVLVGPSEAMSKSKKNVVDPEKMIKAYGADAVRWFILSDSPPEKDVQWSQQGVNAAYKFLQKIYNLNSLIQNREENETRNEEEFKSNFNNYIFKITNLIENFQLNVAVANIYEIYNLFYSNLRLKVSNKCLKENFIKFLKILIPFTPFLAHECLDQLGVKSMNDWPKIEQDLINKQKVKIAIQINGKTREIIQVTKDLDEKSVINETKKNDKINRNLMNKKITRTIFVKNKIINYLVKN